MDRWQLGITNLIYLLAFGLWEESEECRKKYRKTHKKTPSGHNPRTFLLARSIANHSTNHRTAILVEAKDKKGRKAKKLLT